MLLKKIILSLLVVPAVIYLARVGVADFLRLAPTTYIDSVQKGEVRPVPIDLVKSRDQLLRAQSWDKSNPLIPEYLGQVAFVRAQLIGFSPAVQAIFLREAVHYFQIATDLRPNSATLWADRMTAGSWLMQINAKLGLHDQNVQAELAIIQTAMCRASVLAPWEPSVLRQVIGVGQLRYFELTPEVRSIVDAAVSRAKQLNIIV